MVNYHDPATITQESGVPALCRLWGLAAWFILFDSGACEALACHEWYIYVRSTVLPCYYLVEYSFVTFHR